MLTGYEKSFSFHPYRFFSRDIGQDHFFVTDHPRNRPGPQISESCCFKVSAGKWQCLGGTHSWWLQRTHGFLPCGICCLWEAMKFSPLENRVLQSPVLIEKLQLFEGDRKITDNEHNKPNGLHSRNFAVWSCTKLVLIHSDGLFQVRGKQSPRSWS